MKRSSRSFTVGSVLVGLTLAFYGCGLIDLRPVTVTVNPAESGVVLEAEATPLTVSYDTLPELEEAEAAFSVKCGDAAVSGDISWAGSTMSFTPVPPWIPGAKYQLRLGGKVRMADGRSATLSINRFFTAVIAQGGPRLNAVLPANGASYASGSPLTFSFDSEMNRSSVESAISVSPSVDLRFSWDSGGRVLTATPVDDLKALECYVWRFNSGAKDAIGALLQGDPEGRFYVDQDIVPPYVLNAAPATRNGSTWTPASAQLEGMDGDSAILITFSEPVLATSLENCLSIVPTVSGGLEMVSDSSCVFIPADGYLPNVRYALIVKVGVEDEAGLQSQAEWRQEFGTLAYFFAITRISSSTPADGEMTDFSGNPPVYDSTVTAPVTGDMQLEIEFSDSLSPEAQIDFMKKMTLSAFFPIGLSSPSLKSIQWTSDTIVNLNYEDFTQSEDDVDRYYELIVKGGMGGLRSGSTSDPVGGPWMEEDFKVLLRTKREGE